MKVIAIIALLFAFVACIDAQIVPQPSSVYVKSIAYGGSGCPQGSVGTNFNNDRTAFTLLFDRFVAQAGPGIAPTENRKNCQLNLNINVPNGYRYSLVTVDYRGYVELEAGVLANQQSAYYFQGNLKQATARSSFFGPTSQNYVYRDKFAFETVVWSPCGGNANMNINSVVQVNNNRNRNAQGMITTDSIDGRVEQKFAIVWSRC